MPRVKLSSELKQALSELPSKEKDKLIFRLLPRDSKLVDKLIYNLLEEQSTLEERRDNLREKILNIMIKYPGQYYSPNYLTLELRDISGRITYHKDITGDKLGEIEFNFLMIREIMNRNLSFLKQEGYFTSFKFNEYVIKRVIKLIKLISKLHEDYRLEFEDDMMTVGEMISEIPSMKNNITEHGIDIEKLKRGELQEF